MKLFNLNDDPDAVFDHWKDIWSRETNGDNELLLASWMTVISYAIELGLIDDRLSDKQMTIDFVNLLKGLSNGLPISFED